MTAGRLRLTEHFRILTDNFRPVPLCFRFGPDNGYRLRVANDLDSRRRAYGLVYRQYLEKEYTPPLDSRLWLTLHDALPETVTLMVERGDEVIAAITAVPDSPLGLPADELYRTELNGLRASGRRLCELISLGVSLGEQESLVLAKLFCAAYIYAYRVARETDFVITITPRHARFYRRLLCFENLGPARSHARVSGTVGCLERIRLATGDAATPEGRLARQHRTLYRFFEGPAGEAEVAEMIRRSIRPMTESQLRHFFLERTDLFLRAQPAQLSYLAERYLPYEVLSTPSRAANTEAVMA